MRISEILKMLKANLEIVNGIHDTYLGQLLTVAQAEIAREGIVIAVTDDTYSFDDANLIVMYAAYLYRNRAADDRTIGQYNTAAFSGQGMPRMLRYALNNRLLSQKMGAES